MERLNAWNKYDEDMKKKAKRVNFIEYLYVKLKENV